MAENFTHLHVHSEYSLLDGAIRVRDLARAAAASGFNSLALTDHGATYGLIPFYKEMKDAGLNPILGCEAYLEPPAGEAARAPYHLVLLAETEAGYRNILKLVSLANLDNFHGKPLMTKEWLRGYHSGIIALSGCIRGEIPRLLLAGDREGAENALTEMLGIFGPENFFLEIQRHGIPAEDRANQSLIDMAARRPIGLVAANDVHYLGPRDAANHDLLLAVQTLATVNQENRLRMANSEYYLKTSVQMRALFHDLPEAIGNTALIAERCRVELEFGKFRIPHFPVPEGYTAESYLKNLCGQGLAEKFPSLPESVRERLDFELKIINETKLAGYFLIVWDLVAFARRNRIPVGPGRGSAVGSLAAYLLGITAVNPLEFGLIFERFLNPERLGLPDIDIDLCHRGRPKVLEYVRQKYGRDCVAHLAAYTTLKPRAAVRDVGRALGVSYETVDKIAKAVPYFSSNLESAVAESQLLREYGTQPEVAQVITAAQGITGLPRHLTQHAAGIVIADGPLTGYVALQKAGEEEIVTQSDMTVVDDLGLVKIDLLGLRYLTIIDQTIAWLNREGNPIQLEEIPLDDPAIYEALGAGKTIGVFQLESGGMRRLLQRYRPENLHDLAAILALFRPGPLGSGVVESFIKRRFGKERVACLHPCLEKVLEDTYGIILYQEQVMQVAQALAGFSLGEADVLRKAVSKRNPEALARQSQTFITRAVNRGVAQEIAEQVFNQINEFGHYGFPKGHAAAYAYTSYRSVYLKTYFPRHYHAALLTLNWGGEDRFCQYLSEVRYQGIKLMSPDINRSDAFFTPEPEGIRVGMGMIKDLGERGITAILDERTAHGPYCSFLDFCRRLRGSSLSVKVIRNMIKIGVFDSLEKNRAQLLLLFHNYWNQTPKNDPGQMNLFQLEPDVVETNSGVQLPDYEDEVKQELEREILGHYITRNPLDSYKEKFKAWNIRQSRELREEPGVEKAILCGFLSGVRSHRTKRGERMYFAVLEDLTGLIDLIFFPQAVAKFSHIFMERQPLLIKGKIDHSEESPTVIVEEVKLIP